ncbi:hypothetical protein DY000_02007808 [Brassica cretica]|uniref:Uncharacterized protein n=1 Tax=Brassica cretica TaxID=69181 RepID=A0ABQ7BTF7_BRACR|nr:hypothetical protein DY000_02007808 [Brassica cretica]
MLRETTCQVPSHELPMGERLLHRIEETGENDGVEEADEDQDEEKGDEPSEGSSEARNDETTPQVEDEGTDPPVLSADGVNVDQEQVGRVDEQVEDAEEAGTNSGE